MTIDEIRQLIQLANETGVAELEITRGDNRVRIRRTALAAAQDVVLAAPAAVVAASLPAASAPAAEPAPGKAGTTEKAEKLDKSEKPSDPSLHLVKSPIVGTFYECPSPGAPPFVRVGERVQPGKVLCIIESMKLMNEIEAEVSGIVESKLVLNGQPVEYGEALFAVRAV